MEDVKIVKQFTKFIYPFKYCKNSSSIGINKTRDGKEQLIWILKKIDGHELREGIADLFSDDENCSARIANCYKLNDRIALDLPNNKNEYLFFKCREDNGSSYKVRITDVCLYLFESEVGFTEITCEYESQDINNYIDCNYFISEVKSDKNVFRFNKRVSKEDEINIEFNVKELLQRVMKYAGDYKFFDNEGKEFCEKKPIIYSYLLLENRPNNLEAILFLTRKNFKDSYKLPQSEYQINNNPYIFQTFENSFWVASQNGAANISYLINDEKTNDFFKENFPSKLYAAYYHLFLCVLHQKYAMRRLTADMGRLDKIENNDDERDRQLKEGRDYQTQAALLKFRAFFQTPSNIEHINKYYQTISNTFEIDLIYNCFNTDLNNIVSIIDTIVTSKKDKYDLEQKLRKEKMDILVAVLGSVFTFATLFNSSWIVLERTFGETMSFLSPQILIVLAALLITISIIIFIVRSRFIEIKRLKNKLKELDIKI